jgi:hypothetical protein
MNLIQTYKQIKKQTLKNYYDVSRAEDELFDMLQSNRLYNKKYYILDFIKNITGNDGDSYTIRETGKLLSNLFNEIKIQYKIKES